MAASSEISQTPKQKEELQQLLLILPEDRIILAPSQTLAPHFYQGYWIPNLEVTIAFQNHFKAQDTDIILTSSRKAGTTWLKALIYSICNRFKYHSSHTPLTTYNPHELVPQFESNIYAQSKCPDYLDNIAPPRLFGTHLPFELLPDSIRDSKCKIVHICRNPFDTFISSWLFYMKLNPDLKDDMKIEQYFEKFCSGEVPFGPFWDHALGYYNQSLERPDKVLFVKYEELKADPVCQTRKMAEFVGFPFSEEESREGVIEDIVSLCSLQKLKETDAAKRSSRLFHALENGWLFRKGEVGDWVNYLTSDMVNKLEKVIDEKFKDSGLTFKY